MPSGCYQARAQLSNAPPNVAQLVGSAEKNKILGQHTSPSILELKWTLHMKKFLFNHCEVRFDLARVSPPRDTKLQNGRSVAVNRAPLLVGCCGARSQL